MKKIINLKRVLLIFSLICTNLNLASQIPTLKDCQNSDVCYCSVVCKFRKKNSSDNPVYVENDPYGKYCYCKPWDRDHVGKKNTDGMTCKDIEQARAQFGE